MVTTFSWRKPSSWSLLLLCLLLATAMHAMVGCRSGASTTPRDLRAVAWVAVAYAVQPGPVKPQEQSLPVETAPPAPEPPKVSVAPSVQPATVAPPAGFGPAPAGYVWQCQGGVCRLVRVR